MAWRRVATFGAEGTEAGNFCRPWGVAIMRFSGLANSWTYNNQLQLDTKSVSPPDIFNKWSGQIGVGFGNDFISDDKVTGLTGNNNNSISSSALLVNWSYLIAVADRSNNRVQVFKFDSLKKTVIFLHMFGSGPGARHGQFDRPAGIVFNPELEQIIVADKDNHRVQIFDLSGSYLFKFGERGSKCGQFCYPWDIDVCKETHNIIVSDTRNRRIQMFNNLGRYITHFNQPLDSPRGVVFLNPLQLVVSDFNKHRLVLIVPGDDKQVTSSTSTLNNNGKNYLSNNLTLPIGHKAITHHQSNQQQLQQTFHESKFIGFGEGSSWGEFLRPQGATTNGSTVFCSDSRNNRVACWNKDTQSFSYISKDVADLDRPAGLAAIDNFIVIVDFGNNRIHVCQYVMFMDNWTWRRVATFGAEGTEAGKFCRPWGVAIMRSSGLSNSSLASGNKLQSETKSVDSPTDLFNKWSSLIGVGFGNEYLGGSKFMGPHGNNNNNSISSSSIAAEWSYLIAVADRSNNRVQVFRFDALEKTVTFLHMFGNGPGARHGQFDRPAGIVFNPELEQIIVADKDNHRVQIFDLSGSYLFKFGERGSKCGQFCYPWDIDVCKDTYNIIVSDTRNRRIQMFNNLGRYITHFNQPLDSPRGVVFLNPLQLVVSDFNKHRLVIIMPTDDKQVTSSTSSACHTNLITSMGNNNTIINNGNNYLSNNLTLPIGHKAITHHQSNQQQLQQTFHESKFIGFGEGSSWGEFLRPQGATTNGSTVFCSDSRNNRVACWNKDTQSFSYISKDVVDLDRPAGLAAIDNFIVIVDFGNNRIHICQYTGIFD